VLTAHPGEAFRVKDLCDILYPGLPTRAHIAKTNHEVRKVVTADPDWTYELSTSGRHAVFFNRANASSVPKAEAILAPKPTRLAMRRPPRPRRAGWNGAR
jgi:hypothetical protein